jgi:MFS family permease
VRPRRRIGYLDAVEGVPAAAERPARGLGSNYWKLWTSSAASNLADGVFWVALPLLAVRLTDSPILVAGVAVAARLPWLFFSLVAGALADRLDRRRTMTSVAVLRTAVTAALAIGIAMGWVGLPVLYFAAFALGIGETLFDTAAQSIMPSVVERDQLSQANGRLYAVELTTNQFVGPPLGGLLAGLAIPLAFAGSAAGFAFAAVGLALIVGSFRPPPSPNKASLADDIREGLHYLRGHRVLRTLAVMVGGGNLASSAVFAVLVLYAVTPGPMGLDELGYGLLLTAFAAGSVAGSFVVERVERRLGRSTLLTVCVVGMAASMAAPGLTAHAWIIGVAFAVSGLCVVMWNVVTVSLRQRIVPDRLLGRVNASYRLLAWGSQPIGALLGGLAGQAVGLPAVFLLAGVGSATLVLGSRIVTDEAIEAAERASEAAERASEAAGRASEAEAEGASEAEDERAVAGSDALSGRPGNIPGEISGGVRGGAAGSTGEEPLPD